MSLNEFPDDIARFNRMYGLPINERPTFPGLDRLAAFYDILDEEVGELDDLRAYLAHGGLNEPAAELRALTSIADLLADVVVYCFSEAARCGIPLGQVLKLVMTSNFSKLDADGAPIYDERGKVLKGPNFFPPEPAIAALLTTLLSPPEEDPR